MRKLLTYLRPYTIVIVAALVMMFIELAIELAQPLIISIIIDEGIIAGDSDPVWRWGLLMIGLSFISLVAGVFNSFFAAHVSQSVGWQIRDDLFAKIQQFSFANLSVFSNASLTTRLTNDVTQIQNTLLMSMRIMARAPALVIGGVVMAFVINWRIAIVLLVTVPILFVFLVWLFVRAGRLFRGVQKQLDVLNGIVHENLTAVRLVKAFVRRKFEGERFQRAAEQLRDRTTFAFRYVEVTMPVILLLMNIGIIGVLWLGNVNINTGNATTGEVVAIINYSTRTAMALGVFSMIIMNLSRAKASSDRIFEVLESKVDEFENDKRVDDKAIVGDIRMANVSFSYNSSPNQVLRNIDLSFEPKSSVAILGATGSGKTTLMQLIARLYEPDDGQIYIDQSSIDTYPLKNYREQIGYVPQAVTLLSGTIRDVVSFGHKHADDEQIAKALQAAQIYETVIGLPEGLDTLIGQRGVNLSGGQKQRLTIARALLRKPSILLLDDSTSALDATTEMNLLKAIEAYGCTTVIVTQKVSTTKAMDQVILLNNGEIESSGTHEDLLNRSAIYREIYESQHERGHTQ
ncbi:ABC transporter ATP-binding protein [Geomicrobium sp. JSM 1781026]|uniref:ABC transporter ATP-binding protein n=1 Tax=Geomicrobium sp. JSM 1781026 TaxID=3344580 RepID=UPI0035BF9575